MKRKVLIDFSKTTDDTLLIDAKTVITSMTNNPNFENPTPSVAEISLICDAYDSALVTAKHTKSKQDVEAKNDAKMALQNALSKMATYVNMVADSDVVKLNSSGFELNKLPQKHGILPAPHAITLASLSPNHVELKIDKVENADGYLVLYRKTGEEVWQSELLSKISGTIKGLASVTKYEFKVAATSSASSELNEYNYTQIVTIVVQ